MITISDTDPRSIRAVEIAAGAAQWLTCRFRDGMKAYGVPSQSESGRYYIVTTERCDCADAQRHAGQPCKHVLAVRLHLALMKGAQHVKPCRPASRSEFSTELEKPSRVETGTAEALIRWEQRSSATGETFYLPRRAMTDAENAAFWRRFED